MINNMPTVRTTHPLVKPSEVSNSCAPICNWKESVDIVQSWTILVAQMTGVSVLLSG